jgi:hypothetical protein
VELHRGSPSGAADEPSWSATAVQPKARFGASVCARGDVTGDGYDDVLLCAPRRRLDREVLRPAAPVRDHRQRSARRAGIQPEIVPSGVRIRPW